MTAEQKLRQEAEPRLQALRDAERNIEYMPVSTPTLEQIAAELLAHRVKFNTSAGWRLITTYTEFHAAIKAALQAERDRSEQDILDLKERFRKVTEQADLWAARASRYIQDEQVYGTVSELRTRAEKAEALDRQTREILDAGPSVCSTPEAAAGLLMAYKACIERAGRAEQKAIACEDMEKQASDYATSLKVKLAKAEADAERYKADRDIALAVKTKEGLTASEWVLRTGRAERELAEAVEALRPFAAMRMEEAYSASKHAVGPETRAQIEEIISHCRRAAEVAAKHLPTP